MDSKLELSQAELQRLRRILACGDLRKQRFLAVQLLVSSGFMLIGFPLLFAFSPSSLIIGAFVAMVLFSLGVARLGYYRLFRLIHYLGTQHELQEESCDNKELTSRASERK